MWKFSWLTNQYLFAFAYFWVLSIYLCLLYTMHVSVSSHWKPYYTPYRLARPSTTFPTPARFLPIIIISATVMTVQIFTIDSPLRYTETPDTAGWLCESAWIFGQSTVNQSLYAMCSVELEALEKSLIISSCNIRFLDLYNKRKFRKVTKFPYFPLNSSFNSPKCFVSTIPFAMRLFHMNIGEHLKHTPACWSPLCGNAQECVHSRRVALFPPLFSC